MAMCKENVKAFIEGIGGRILLLTLSTLIGITTSIGAWWAKEVGDKVDRTTSTVASIQVSLTDRIHTNELRVDRAVTREEWTAERLRVESQQRDTERTITDMRISAGQTAVSLNAIEKKLDQLLRDKP